MEIPRMTSRSARSTPRLVITSLLAMTIAACAPLDERPAPIEDRSVGRAGDATARPAAAAPVPEYEVRRGDTLYGIAFRNGLDYRELARWNDIVDPYVIHPGQRLRLGPPGAIATAATRGPGAPGPTAAETDRIRSIPDPAPARMEPLPDRPIPAQNREAVNPVAASRVASAAGATAAGTPGTTPSTPVVAGGPVSQAIAPAATPAPPASGGSPATATPPVGSPTNAAPATPTFASRGAERTVEGVRWRWPAEGRLINTFISDDPTRQGIDIMGTEGQPVIAAADGEVVYSGSGLIGYGELIIIKHTDNLLSAYGHNRRRLVEEGARVRAGQVIAEMGRSGGRVPMLHFEIRRNGRPVDPRGFLPPR
jgi:lipoprotein NlpD